MNIWHGWRKIAQLIAQVNMRHCIRIEVDAVIERGEIIEPLFGRAEPGCFWTVYARRQNNLLDAVADFNSEFAARACARLAGLLFSLPVRVWSAS